MVKKKFAKIRCNIMLFVCLFCGSVKANESMERFLKNCGVGIATGAALGVVYMSIQDQPSDHGRDIAKGASLGLYGGLIYSYYDLTYEPKNRLGIELGDSHEILPLLRVTQNQIQLGIFSGF